MPTQTQSAVNWTLQQTYTDGFGKAHAITKDDAGQIVDKVREYFNTNKVTYATFSYDDLKPFFN